MTKISAKHKANGLTLTDSGSDVFLKHLRDFDGLIWILSSAVSIGNLQKKGSEKN